MREELLQSLRKSYPLVTRVVLIHMDDVQAPPTGTKGTVKGIDDIGSILVAWNNGSSLNVIYGEDEIQIINERICPKCNRPYSDHPAISRVNNKTLICLLCEIKENFEAAGISKEEQDKIIEAILKK